MSVIIRLQNLPWSANALDIRNFFRGLSIPEGGVHIVGGELGDAFIAFSTDEDARQAMILDGGKIKEIQVKLLLSSRSEMHKVIEAARQSVPIMSLAPPAPVIVPTIATEAIAITTGTAALTQQKSASIISPFSAALGNNPLSNFGIPGIGNPQEIPQPAVIEPPAPLISPNTIEDEKESEKPERIRKDRRRSRSRSRSRDRKDRKRDRRDRSRSRERRRRDRSRSRERRDRKRDRKDRSRSRDRSPSRRTRERKNTDMKSQESSQERSMDSNHMGPQVMSNFMQMTAIPTPLQILQSNLTNNSASIMQKESPNRFNDPDVTDTFNKIQDIGKKRNPNAFQGEQQNNGGANRIQGDRGGVARGGGNFRREGRVTRFDNDQQQHDSCVAIRNAPNHTSYGDVRRFFPFLIDKHGIKMINDKMGRRTGNIFVKFCESRSKQIVLQRKNNELKGAVVAVESLDDEAYDKAVDSYLPYREDNNEEDPNLVIADNDVNSELSFTVLKMTDLPNFVKEHDIIKTFSEYSLLSIMINDCRVSRSKTAYVQFVKPEDARLALDRKADYIFGRRQPIITPVTDQDFEKAKASQNDKSIPDTVQIEEKVEVAPQEVAAPRDPRQRRQQFDNGANQQNQNATPQIQPGPPFFSGPFAQQPGFPAPFGNSAFGSFPVGNLDPRTAASNWANRPPFPIPPKNSTDIEDEPLDCVLMKGLPCDATDRTIVNFLKDTGARPVRVHLLLDVNGSPSGDCFCEFQSPKDARMAAKKHGSNLEGGRVTVDPVPRSVVEEALEGPKQPEPPIRDGLLGNGPPQPQFYEPPIRGSFGGPRGAYRGRGGFDRGGFNQRRGGFDQVRGGFDQGRGGFDQGRGGFDQGRGGFDQGRGGFDQGRGGFDQSRGGFDQSRGGFERGRGYRGRGSYERGSRGGFDRGRGRGFGRGRGGIPENGIPREEEQEPAPPEDFGAPGCVVSMENVPFRASIDDIMGFFSEFDLTQDDVIRRYNERGQPTGDARVAFRTPFDAQRAVKTRHMDMIHERRISLCVL